MASDVQDGGQNSKEHIFGIIQNFCVLFFGMILNFHSIMRSKIRQISQK
jgi:hypothetical protein